MKRYVQVAARHQQAARDARAIAEQFGLPWAEVTRRKHYTIRIRVAWLLAQRGYSQVAIAAALGYADHSTVNYHLRAIDAQLARGQWPFGT